jgi:hypothetical protein
MYVITNDSTGAEIDTVETEAEAIALVWWMEMDTKESYSYRFEAGI